MIAMIFYLAIAPPGRWVWYPLDWVLTVVFMLLWLYALGLVLPLMIDAAAWLARRPLARRWGATGRLVADNLGRSSARGRVMLTIVALAVGLTMMVGLTGGMAFLFDELFGATFRRTANQQIIAVAVFDPRVGAAAFVNMDSMRLPPGAAQEMEAAVGSNGAVVHWNFVIAPEIAFFPDYFSLVLNPQDMWAARDWVFVFGQGDWEHALPILENGCGILTTPLVARNNGVGLYDHLTITSKGGPLDCVVAGIGQPYINASIISASARDSFELSEPFTLVIVPAPQTDRQQLVAEVQAVAERYDLFLIGLDNMSQVIAQVMDQLGVVASALLLLAILAAALGVVNTTLIGIAERRRELGLLRAVGATRQQALAVITGEAAWMGILSGVWGLAAGLGLVVILATVYGGNAWGVPDLDLWAAAYRSVQPALATGLVGLVAAPLVCAAAAWLPAQTILRGSAIETMNVLRASRPYSVLGRHATRDTRYAIGAMQKRFALGTAVLMLVVLAGLIAVVVRHSRSHFMQLTFDKARQLVAVHAGLVELSLPKQAQQLDWSTLRSSGAFGNDQSLSQFKSLKEDMQRNGLLDLTIADRDNIVLVNMEMSQIGQLAPPLESPDQASAFLEDKDGRSVVQAAAPICNQDGQILGSVRVTLDVHTLDDLQSRLWRTLGSLGLVMVAAGVLISLALSAPLARAAQQLAEHAAQVRGGQYTLFEGLPGRGLGGRIKAAFSVQTRLTIALVVLMVVMVGGLEFAAIPIERYYVEDMLKSNLTVWIEWMAHAASNSDVNLAALLRGRTPSPAEMMDMLQAFDLERLQQVGNDAFGQEVAYVALVNNQGKIVLSDQLALIDELVPVPADTTIRDETWRNESVWSVSTPLQSENDRQLGALKIAVRRQSIEDFIGTSRNLFALCGLIAVLAGVLMAQAIGGAVAAPVSQLAEGTRRVGQGDLSVRFRLDTRDELAILANAYNQMVTGLREREWLRDMFGRFVSQEVAEAIRTGQVKLEGENRVISVLFCDIRGFTARSEKSTPEKIVALLNEYLPVVIGAAQHHQGTVNKFGGDSTLVIYGAPRKLQESAYQAVLTALEMRVNLSQLNEKLVERGEEPIRIGVGINTGVALAGAVGPKERQEYTVIGDTVNLASRIEALNKEYPDYGILISGQTYDALGSRRSEFEWEDLGPVAIRGKAEPVRVWAVQGVRSGSAGSFSLHDGL
jgi:class 3 adenylate cyclase